MAEADCTGQEDKEEPGDQAIDPAKLDEEIMPPLEELAYVKSHRMRRVRWSEDLEEIRYFSVKAKKDKRRASVDSAATELTSSTPNHERRRLSDLPISSIEKFKTWLDDKDFKSDVVLLGLKMKSAFKKADFYDTEKDWDDVFDSDTENVALSRIAYKR